MIQFITHHAPGIDYVESARIALEGGCRWIQLRMKDVSTEEFIAAGRQIEPLCRQYGAIFLLNDHIELVKLLNADGVHLGKNDMPIDEARRILGPDSIIGGTANTIDDIKMHVQRGANYIGCGPFRFTTTKEKLSPVLGIDGYSAIVKQMKSEGITIPVVAIGGINAEDIPDILHTGINGIALSGTVLRAENPIEEMKKLMEITDKNTHTTWKN